MKADALTDMLVVELAGGRFNGKKTKVLESRYYGRNGDPSNHFEFPAEIERRKKLKAERRAEQANYRNVNIKQGE